MAIGEAASFALWLRPLLEDFRIKQKSPTLIWCDNQGAIKLLKNPIHSQRTRHIDVRFHSIREDVEKKNIIVEYVPTKEQKADFMTKPLTGPTFEENLRMLTIN